MPTHSALSVTVLLSTKAGVSQGPLPGCQDGTQIPLLLFIYRLGMKMAGKILVPLPVMRMGPAHRNPRIIASHSINPRNAITKMKTMVPIRLMGRIMGGRDSDAQPY